MRDAVAKEIDRCMKEVIAIMPSIADAYEKLNKKRIWELSFLLILMVLSLGVILFGLVRGRKMRLQIQKAYSKNKQMNADLQEAVERLKVHGHQRRNTRNASIYPNEDFEKHLMDIGKL